MGSSAVANDKLSLSHNGRDTAGSAMRQKQFTEWLQNVFDRFYEDITEENPRKCLAEKFKDKLGSDCALDIEDGDIDNACWKLNDFFVWRLWNRRKQSSFATWYKMRQNQ